MLFMRLTSASTLRRHFHFAMLSSSHSSSSLYIILSSVVGSPSSLYQLLQILFHKSKLIFHLISVLSWFRSLFFLTVSFLFQWLNNIYNTVNPPLAGDSTFSPFHDLYALVAASCTWIILCLDACCKASTTFKSLNFSFSCNDSNCPNFSIILHTPTLH